MPRRCPNPANISTDGLASSAFARHYLRNLVWFLFLALLRCFSSGGSPPMTILFTIGWQTFICRVAPFGYPRIYRLLTAPRGFSQLTASFFGSQCQGIPLALFVAWPYFYVRLSSVRNIGVFHDRSDVICPEVPSQKILSATNPISRHGKRELCDSLNLRYLSLFTRSIIVFNYP